MPAPPPNKKTKSTAQRVKRLVVLVGNEDGDNPTLEDEVDWLKPLMIINQSGGAQLPTAIFEYDLTRTGERIVDQRTPTQWKRIVEIRQCDDRDKPIGACLFWGELSIQEDMIDKAGERATVTASVEPYHFGDGENGATLRGLVVYDPVTEERVTITAGDITFNPESDGYVWGNRSDHTNEAAEDEPTHYLWVHDGQIRSIFGRGYAMSDSDEKFWTLRQALNAIQISCNPDETWISNDIDPGAVADWLPLKAMTLPTGGTLPQFLDALLEPVGCSWYIAFGLDEDGNSTRQIKIFNRTKGPTKELYLQRPGEDIGPAKNNAMTLRRKTDIGSLVNKVLCEGGVEEREVTIELLRAWFKDDDDLGTDDLKISEKGSSYNTDDKVDVWRLWVANEANDWRTIRSAEPEDEYDPLDLEGVFSEYVPRRRVFHDCLTHNGRGERRKPFLEYKLEDEWVPVPPEWGFQVLRDQLGIRFTGDIPPEALVNLGADAKLRITATIHGDKRLEATGDGTEKSPNGRVIRMTLDVSDRFVDRKRMTTGTLQSVIATGDTESDARQDTEDIQAYADKIVAWESAADVSLSAGLLGVLLDYQIGDMIRRVKGREISLNRNSAASGTERFPQVIGLKFDVEKQATELTLSAYDKFLEWNVADAAVKPTTRKPPVARRDQEKEMPYVPPLAQVHTHRVLRLDNGRGLWRKDVTAGTSSETNPITAKSAHGVAIGADDTYWVASNSQFGTIRRYSLAGTVLQSINTADGVTGTSSFTSDDAGNLYMLTFISVTNSGLQKRDPDGEIVWTVDLGNNTVSEMQCDAAGNCYVLLTGTTRLQKWTTAGSFAWETGVESGTTAANGIRVDRETGMVGLDREVFNTSGSQVRNLFTDDSLSAYVVAIGGSRIWIHDSTDDTLKVLNSSTFAQLIELDDGNDYVLGWGLSDGSCVLAVGTDIPADGGSIRRYGADYVVDWQTYLGRRATTPESLWDLAVSADRVIIGGDGCDSL